MYELHRREQNQATEEGCQADPVSRSKSAQKRQHKRIEGEYSVYCLMHESLKQSLCGASSGSPNNALHSQVIVKFALPNSGLFKTMSQKV